MHDQLQYTANHIIFMLCTMLLLPCNSSQFHTAMPKVKKNYSTYTCILRLLCRHEHLPIPLRSCIKWCLLDFLQSYSSLKEHQLPVGCHALLVQVVNPLAWMFDIINHFGEQVQTCLQSSKYLLAATASNLCYIQYIEADSNTIYLNLSYRRPQLCRLIWAQGMHLT